MGNKTQHTTSDIQQRHIDPFIRNVLVHVYHLQKINRVSE